MVMHHWWRPFPTGSQAPPGPVVKQCMYIPRASFVLKSACCFWRGYSDQNWTKRKESSIYLSKDDAVNFWGYCQASQIKCTSSSWNHWQVYSCPGLIQRDMSSTAGAAPPTSSLVVGLDTGRQWHHRAMQRSRALVKTYLLSSSVPPLPPTGRTRLARNPLRLPALATAKGPHRQTTLAPLR